MLWESFVVCSTASETRSSKPNKEPKKRVNMLGAKSLPIGP